ncbi:type VII secretion integral membrane protein EccD [Amycolatopsis antarctica]|uniref:Type VII secretion integral membrane protein EccD n=1 Tax=Amycolatopsis antarctica TaxID=1854586 RepID=A0A263CY22_9PSEU|nr:type VII secretion integral membrane protein EccD [Amycolatopsis antarctica]OZM70828.1 type VII secretion integral membrane protein EccD [Amycolatopsis antarctica]
MTSTMNAELCRITVHGPGGQADLAVPISTTVSALLPVLVRNVVREEDVAGGSEEYGSWVLQRLGEAPFDPDGTPETLDWFEGEEFHLAPAADPLPELDFDDIADGMATAVNRHSNRWNETINRRLFLGLASLAFGTIGLTLLSGVADAVAATTAGVLALILAVAAVLVARTLADRVLAAVIGLPGCLFAALAGMVGTEGVQGTLELRPDGVLIGGVAMTVTAVALLIVQRLFAQDLPIVPFGCAAVAGFGAILAVWMHTIFEFSPQQNAGVLVAMFFLVTLFAPKLATRAARLRGPQLPRTGDELKIDVEPAPAEEVVTQTGHADRYLSVLAIGASAVIAAGLWYLIEDPTWVTYTLTGLFTVLVLLRSREFLNVGQRLAFAAAGSWGVMLFALSMLSSFEDVWRVVGVLVLLGAALLLVLAALREQYRRVLPIWPHLGNIAENLFALASVPLLLQLLGVFAWARGLAG